MPDKTVVKYTRDGIQEKNLSTGETSMLTVSVHAKEMRYSSRPPETVYQGKYNHHQQPLLLPGQSAANSRLRQTGKKLPNPTRLVRSTLASVNDSIYDSFQQSDDVGLQSLGSVRNSVVHTDRAIRYIRRNRGLPRPTKLLRSAVRGINNRVLGSLSESDDVGLQAVGSSMNNVAKMNRWVRRIRGGKQRTLSRHRIIKTSKQVSKVTFQAAGRLSGATQKMRAASAAAQQIGKFMGAIVKIAANPATWTALAVVAAVIAGIILVSVMTNLITGSLVGSTSDTALAAYVMQLDEKFQEKIVAEQQKYEQRGFAVTVEGEDSVTTNPNALAILVTGDWTVIELNDANKKKMADVHGKLYSYSVKEDTAASSVASSIANNSAEESAVSSQIRSNGRVTITIHVVSPEQAVSTLGFAGEKAAHVTEMLKVLDEISMNTDGTDVNVGTGEYIWAVPGHTRISSPYGSRTDPINGTTAFHTGLDIPAPTGTPVVASADGTVIRAGVNGGYGNCVIIQHKDGVQTLYGHNSALLVNVGETVKQGQVIAKVGQTGRATGPHSHFEFRINGKHVNPKPYLKGAMPDHGS